LISIIFKAPVHAKEELGWVCDRSSTTECTDRSGWTVPERWNNLCHAQQRNTQEQLHEKTCWLNGPKLEPRGSGSRTKSFSFVSASGDWRLDDPAQLNLTLSLVSVSPSNQFDSG